MTYDTVTRNYFTPSHQAIEFSTPKLKKHYLKLQSHLWAATELKTPRYMHTHEPTIIGFEINIILTDMEDVAKELKSRGVFMPLTQSFNSLSEYHAWAAEKREAEYAATREAESAATRTPGEHSRT